MTDSDAREAARPATVLDLDRLVALNYVTMLPGIPSKRFVRDLARIEVGHPLSHKQIAYIESLAWRYRRQMPPSLVPETKPAGA